MSSSDVSRVLNNSRGSCVIRDFAKELTTPGKKSKSTVLYEPIPVCLQYDVIAADVTLRMAYLHDVPVLTNGGSTDYVPDFPYN